MTRKWIYVIVVVLVACCAACFGVRHEVQRAGRMQEALDSALAQNQNYIAFTSDSMMKEVVVYYDHPLRFWITANDRLRAHYALGCVYRDLHDAPIALLSWEDAIAAADTAAADCDYATLFRVYGQMADVYFRQSMPEKELSAREAYSNYALHARDTLNFIRGLLLKNDAYLALGDTAAIYQNIDQVRQLYLERGMNAEAARVYPTAIRISVDQQRFGQANSMIQIFEHESGLFSEEGTIAQGYERYYYNKGMYYLGVGQPDSAELQFRKLLPCEPTIIDAYRGLLALFEHTQAADSIFKYNRLYEDAIARYLRRTHILSIDLSEGMFDYSRQQQIAQAQEKKAHRSQIALLLLAMAGGLGILLTYARNLKKKRNAKMEQKALLEKYDRAMQELQANRIEASIIQHTGSEDSELQSLLQDKNEKIDSLESLVNNLQKQINGAIPESNENFMDLVQSFHEMAHPHTSTVQGVLHARAAKKSEWNKLSKAMKLRHPHFYLYTSIEHHLAPQEYKVCMLSYLNFEIVEMATLLGISKQSVTNTRASVAKKLFGLGKASILNENLRNL